MIDYTDKIVEILREATNNPKLKVNIDDTPGDIAEWDSLTHIKIISSIEDFFEIRFRLRELAQIKSIRDIIVLINQKKESK
jgi:acyl carrier protein